MNTSMMIMAGVTVGLQVLSSLVQVWKSRNAPQVPQVPAGQPMPPATPPHAATIPSGPGAHPVLDALAQALMSHQVADMLHNLGAKPSAATPPIAQAPPGSVLLADIAQIVEQVVAARMATQPAPKAAG